MPIIKAEAGGGVKLEPGTYEVTCIAVSEDRLEKPLFGNGHMIKLKLEVADVMDENGDPVTLSASASYKLSPLSKLWGWVTAFGFDLEVDQDFDTDDLLGMRCQALIGQKKKDDGSVWSQVESLFPLGKRAQAPRSPARDDGEPDFDAFWKEVHAMGKDNKDVLPLLPNKDLWDMPKQTGADLVRLLEQLSA